MYITVNRVFQIISKTVHHEGGKNPKKFVQNPLNFEIREFLAKIRKSAYLEFFETQFKACISEVRAPTGRISRGLAVIKYEGNIYLSKPPSTSKPVARVDNSSIIILRQAINLNCCAMISTEPIVTVHILIIRNGILLPKLF